MLKSFFLTIILLSLLSCNNSHGTYHSFEKELGANNVQLLFELEKTYLSFLSSNYSNEDSCDREVEYLRDIINQSSNDYNIDTVQLLSVLEKVNNSNLFDQYKQLDYLSVKELKPGSKIIEYIRQNESKKYASYGKEKIVYEERNGLTHAFFRDSLLMTTEEFSCNEDAWAEPISFADFLKKEKKSTYIELVTKGEFIPALKSVQSVYPEFQKYDLDEYVEALEARGYNNVKGTAMYLEKTYSDECSHLSNYFIRRIISYSCFYEHMKILMDA